MRLWEISAARVRSSRRATGQQAERDGINQGLCLLTAYREDDGHERGVRGAVTEMAGKQSDFVALDLANAVWIGDTSVRNRIRRD